MPILLQLCRVVFSSQDKKSLPKHFKPNYIFAQGKKPSCVCCDIVMWMDHRAEEQTTFINSGGHDILKYCGGQVSVEMQVPKLLWLKQVKKIYLGTKQQ